VLEIFFLFEWLKLVIEVYGATFFSLLGLLTNLLIMLILKANVTEKNNLGFKKSFDNIMYKHIFFNPMFNFTLCLIKSFSIVNLCVFTKSSFCSSVYKEPTVQYFKIIFTLFVGNSIQLCSNFSFVLFSLSRFYISTSSRTKFYMLFEKLNLRLFYAIMFALCSLWSIFKLFEYKPNEVYSSFDKNFPYNRFDQRYCQFANNEYKSMRPGCRLFSILNLINNLLNNILFLIVSVVIDVCMVRFANRNYEHKKELIHDRKHLAHKRKVKKLIFTNGLLYFFSHVPEFLSTLLLIVFKERLNFFCFTYFSCTEINEIFESFSLVGISV